MVPKRENLPAELLGLHQFVIWFEEEREEKRTKVPAAPWRTGHWGAASPTDPTNWTDFDTAVKYASKREYGVGFCLREGGGIAGFDLDDCIGADGKISEFASEVIRKANSYTEISPSGRGIRIITKGKLPAVIRNREHGIEVYDRDRFLTLTGRRCTETPKALTDVTPLLEELYERFGEKTIEPKFIDKQHENRIPITRVVPLKGLRKRGKQFQGPHPVHGSTTGFNFSINPEKNAWFCYRHWVGGGPLTWLAIQDGQIRCEDAKRGIPIGEVRKLVKLARERGLIPKSKNAGELHPEKIEIPTEVNALNLDKDPPEEETIELEGAWKAQANLCPGFVTSSGVLIEEIIDENTPKFAVGLPDGSTRIVTAVVYGGRLHMPLEDELLQKGLIKLPGKPMNYDGELKLRERILEVIKRYVDVPAPFAEFCADYVMQTWLYDRTKAQHVLNFRGLVESGKTRGREVTVELSYRGMNLGGAMTPASLFRSAEVWKGTLCIDEGDLPRSSEEGSPVKILNMRCQHDGAIWRVDKETMKLHAFRIFGPTVLCSRKGFFDDALESRCVVIPMEETEREDIPLTLPDEFYRDAAELRSMLLAFRFKHWHSFEVDDSIRFRGVGKRLNQMLQPMASLARSISEELYTKIEHVATELYERQVEERAHSPDGMIIRSYLELKMEGNEEITPTDLSDRIRERFRYELDPKAVGRRLKPLGFMRSKTTGGVRVVKLEEKPLWRGLKRMVPADERERWEAFEFTKGHAAELGDKTLVRALQDIPEIVTSEVKPVGPFKRGQLCLLPPRDAKLFIQRRAAREVEWH